jgi:hypothetical protein
MALLLLLLLLLPLLLPEKNVCQPPLEILGRIAMYPAAALQ